MNNTDKQFVESVNRWRNNDDVKNKLNNFIDDLIESSDEYDSDYHNECDSLWDVGHDDGFYFCTGLVIDKLKEILK